MADENISQKKEEPKKRQKRYPNKNYAVKKRLPLRPIDVIIYVPACNEPILGEGFLSSEGIVLIASPAHDVFDILNAEQFVAQLDKCCDLLARGEKEIILHGLGAAIQRCCNLALQLETLFSGTCQIEVNTGTVDLIDDLEPLTDDLEFDSQVRHSSSIHIRIFRTAMIGANQCQ